MAASLVKQRRSLKRFFISLHTHCVKENCQSHFILFLFLIFELFIYHQLRRRIHGNTIGKAYEDLNSYGRSSSDYFTPEEMLQFKKPKKKKSLRKKEKFDVEALEAEAKTTGLGASDLGSRKDQSRLATKIERERVEAQLRTEAYESALAKAKEASMALSRAETITMVVDQTEEVFGEDYEELQRSLERARKLALSRQEEALVAGPQAVAREVIAKSVEVESQVLADAQENKVVITEMEEFVLGLQLNEGMLLSLFLNI